MSGWAVWCPPGDDARPWILAAQRFVVDQLDVAGTVTTTTSDTRQGLRLVGTGAVTGLLVPDLSLLAPTVVRFNPAEVMNPSRESRPRWLYGDGGMGSTRPLIRPGGGAGNGDSNRRPEIRPDWTR